MLHFPRWKVLAILAVVLAGVVLALPNVLPKSWQDTLGDYTGLRPMTRGLDLQGGTSLLMELDGKDIRDAVIATQVDDVRSLLRQEAIGYQGLERTLQGMRVTITDAAAADKANQLLGRLTQGVAGVTGATVPTFDIARSGQQFTFSLSAPGMEIRTSQATEQAIKVLDYRLNDLGIEEISIQRQGLDRILIQLPGEGISDRVKRVLGMTGALAFQMLCENQPIAATDDPPAHCSAYPARPNLEQAMWVKRTSRTGIDGTDIVTANVETHPDTNEPVVAFKFNKAGAQRLGELTTKNVGQPIAIVFDGQVISAPMIAEPILGGFGQISGNFTPDEANEIVIALRSGALPARLVYINAQNDSAGDAKAKRSDL